jgi:electron transport complex protein RnfD
MENKLIVSYAPHLRTDRSTKTLMLDVLIALVPALLVGLFAFGIRALLHMIICVGVSVWAEHVWCVFMKKETTIYDLSAVVTGLLLAFNLPASAPLWMGAVGAVFAIIIVKCFFGGLGHNFVNPALAARVFLLACWPVQMTTWINPNFGHFIKSGAISGATPTVAPDMYAVSDLFFGNIPGSIGEISAFALILGFIYLLVRRVITWHIPVITVGVVYVFTLITGQDATYQIFAGGLMLGAIFMATDYTTSPMTVMGQIVYAFLIGILTAVIRFYGSLPEGVSYSILIANIVTPLIDKFVKNRIYGGAKK